MKIDSIKRQIEANAEEIRRLHARIHSTFSTKTKSPAHLKEWQEACSEFHAKFDTLSFPGGYERARERITAGDPSTIEAALCFVECRPYFFRSGYMFEAFMRKLKHASLSKAQSERFHSVLSRLKAWRESKQSTLGA
jgi:hypothetical protein